MRSAAHRSLALCESLCQTRRARAARPSGANRFSNSGMPAFAVAFYPGCEAELKRGYEAVAPLLMLVGQADDWTAPGPCRALAREAKGVGAEIEGYAGAYHGFDSDAPVRLRKDVPNGVHPGQGVHVGGNAAAWRASQARLLKFIAEH